jgi:hypothetical protein
VGMTRDWLRLLQEETEPFAFPGPQKAKQNAWPRR